MDKTEYVKLPVEAIPRIYTAGRFYHKDKAFLRKYHTNDSLCLHLYDYPGTVKIGGLTLHFKPGALTIIPPLLNTAMIFPMRDITTVSTSVSKTETSKQMKKFLFLPRLEILNTSA